MRISQLLQSYAITVLPHLHGSSRWANDAIHRCGSSASRTCRRAGLQRQAGRGRCECAQARSEEHTSELQSLLRISYAVFCLKTKRKSIFSTCIQPRNTFHTLVTRTCPSYEVTHISNP